MNCKVFRKLGIWLLAIYFVSLFIFPFKVLADSGYTVRYDSPADESDVPVESYQIFVYKLLKDIDAEIGLNEKFTYSREVSIYDNEPQHEVVYGEGRISMEGNLVEMEGAATKTIILNGTMNLYIETYYTTDGDSTWIDYETESVKSVSEYSYEGPFYIAAGAKEEEGKNLTLGYDPQTGNQADMTLTMIYYNKEDKETYRGISTEFPPSAFNFKVFENNPGQIVQIEDSVASDTPGETTTSVDKGIVLGLAKALVVAGLGAGLGVAGAVATTNMNSSGENEGEKGQSTYKMLIYKEFGDQIKYNADPVFVYARMVEIKSNGEEIERMDLTQGIKIFSNDDILNIGASSLSGSYMGASVYTKAIDDNIISNEGVISFKFTGQGGVFQNNVKFKLIGQARIELEGQQLYVLANSGRDFHLPFKLIDFDKEANITVKPFGDSDEFELEIGKDSKGKDIIIARDKAEKKIFDRFFNSFNCEIIAENEKEYVRNIFSVEMCYEGVLPDFLGKPKEIRGYKVRLDSDEMEETIFDVKLGIWSDSKNLLEFVEADSIEIDLSDEEDIFNLIGMKIQADKNSLVKSSKRFIARAEKNFPSTETIKGSMNIKALYGESVYENKTEIDLIPDVFQYEADFEKEYKGAKRVIEVYMAPRFRANKLSELEKAKEVLGIEDLRLFRRKCWDIAQMSIMQEKQEYLLDEAWYDEAIATLDLVVYVGDIAFDLALAPIGGPIAGFLAANVKNTFIELCGQLYAGTNKSIWDLTKDVAVNRAVQSLGSADGLIEMPKADEPKKLVMWLSSYVVYRIGYHWQFDKDDNNNSIGITEAINRGLLDFIGKGAGALLGDYMKEVGKGRWVESVSVADADQNFLSEGINTLLQYIERLKIV